MPLESTTHSLCPYPDRHSPEPHLSLVLYSTNELVQRSPHFKVLIIKNGGVPAVIHHLESFMFETRRDGALLLTSLLQARLESPPHKTTLIAMQGRVKKKASSSEALEGVSSMTMLQARDSLFKMALEEEAVSYEAIAALIKDEMAFQEVLI